MTPTKLTERQRARLDAFKASAPTEPDPSFMQRVREMFGDHKREPCPYCGSTEPFHSCSRPPLHAIVHELRDALRAQRDHLEDLTTIVNHLETALTRLPAGGQL